MKRILHSCASLLLLFVALQYTFAERTVPVEALSIDGDANSEGGSLVISATLGEPKGEEDEPKLIYALDTTATIEVGKEMLTQRTNAIATVKHGKLERVEMTVSGDLVIEHVRGDEIKNWSLERSVVPEGQLRLLVDFIEPIEAGSREFMVIARKRDLELPTSVQPLFFTPPDRGLLTGSLKVPAKSGVEFSAHDIQQLRVLESATEGDLHYAFSGAGQALSLSLTSKLRPDWAIEGFKLNGDYAEGRFSFALTGVLTVFNPGTYHVPLMSGNAALVSTPKLEKAKVTLRNGRYEILVDEVGRHPFRFEFNAKVESKAGRSMVRFDTLDAALQPVELHHLPVDAERVKLNGVSPKQVEDSMLGYLSGDGRLLLAWTDPSWKSPEVTDATLLYSVESVSQLSVGPGLIRQLSQFDVDVMQGAMRELRFDLKGSGEITQVEGDSILRWEVVGVDEASRQLVLELNKNYEEGFSVRVQSQFAMAAFPAEAQPLRILPQSALRYSGFIRLVNQGAVSIDVPEATGFAQISPEYFPAQDQVIQGSGQVLAYRFSDLSYDYTVLADNILPEVAVSQLLVYQVGLEDQSLNAELELTIREAPLRDFYLEIPKGYALSNLRVPHLADYFVLDDSGEGRQLRLVFSKPVSGRQVIRLNLENNRSLNAGEWTLPSFRALNVKSVRGHVGVVAEPGLRASVQSIEGLSEQATNFFPKEVPNLQLALRQREMAWSAALKVEQMPQAIQADALHLYSVAEGRIYGSSVLNYLISGAPVSEFKLQVAEGMHNLDFSGRDVRGWSKSEDGSYVVQLHSPASGAYTLLATYETQFEAQGAQVSFSGVAPQDVASEQGYVVVVSSFPFALDAVKTNAGLLRLEPNEIPAEFRLLYDAKVLAAFQYTARPMQVELGLKAFAQADSADQVIDFAELKTRVSGDGEILTAVDLMLKSKGQTHFRMQIPEGHQIWSARVEGEKVSPVSVDSAVMLPLPAGHDPNNAVRVQLEVAAKAANSETPVVYAPALFAPSLVVNWQLDSDPDYGLRYLGGDIVSGQVSRSNSGFAWLRAVLDGERPTARKAFLVMLVCGALAVVLSRSFATKGFAGRRLPVLLFQVMLLLGSLGGLAVCALGLSQTGSGEVALQDSIVLRTPVELSSQPLSLQLENRSYEDTGRPVAIALPLIVAVALWGYGFMRDKGGVHFFTAGWLAVFVATLGFSQGPELFLTALLAFFAVHFVRPFSARYLFAGQQALWLIGLVCVVCTQQLDAKSMRVPTGPVATQLVQTIAIEDDIAEVQASLNWTAEAGESYVFLKSPASLIGELKLPEGLRLSQKGRDRALSYTLEAEVEGEYAVSFSYRVRVHSEATGQRVLALPTGWVLSNRASIQLTDTNVSLSSDHAVTIKTKESAEALSRYEVVFRPSDSVQLSWQPERRDSSQEDAVYHVESFDLFTPLSGLVSGYHHYNVRLSQGQLDSLKLKVPDSMTITSVQAKHMVNWQFDPEQRELMLYFQPVQLGTFSLAVFSQYSSGALPYRRIVKSPQVMDAASQLGLVALATDEEVQVGEVQELSATTINLEDFPASFAEQLAHLGRVPALRRAYRWSDANGSLELQALAVKPDVRVTSKQTVSLGEDRILLKADMQAQVNRAGIFKLTVPIPEAYDVESVSSPQLSHWNEVSDDAGTRSLQLHLKGKTMGEVALNVTLSGPGLGERSNYVPPLLVVDGAARSSGTLALVPELGYRLNPTEREAAIQMDPAEAGMSRRKLMLFRILNDKARLAFEVERVDPWVEVERLQTAVIRSGMVEVRARFNFTVENAGIREQVFRLPEGVIGVQFSGEGVSDHEEVSAGQWLVKLNRKMVGSFTVEALYQMPTPNQPERVELQDIEAVGVNQQSGYLALVPLGRLQLEPKTQAAVMQKAESQMVGNKLRGDLKVDEASHVYRVLQPGYRLAVDVLRHDIAELVPAQVRDVDLASVISGKGEMLTKVTLKLDPGDKRMLRISLPENSEFWFGFVNQQSAWPWREGNDVLLQLEANAVSTEDVSVEFFYSTHSVVADSRALRASLRGPKLDLPLENISWTLHYPDSWNVDRWAGNMTQDRVEVQGRAWMDLSSYLRSQEKSKMVKKQKAESLLDDANTLLIEGRQEEARQAFSSAYNLSQFDQALNEDARVQLKNVREEQALVALANRRNVFLNDNHGVQMETQQVAIESSELLNYTDDMVQDVLRGNSAEDNETLRLLASRLIDQQQAVPVNPQAIQTDLPMQGAVASFSRSLQINDQADL
ncbi:MAG: hypothetical protein ACPGJU_09830, partial [Coraliomargarita sp.]